jgi:hypothetical protein
VLAETPVAQQPIGQFAADHAGRAENQNVQDPTPCCFCSIAFSSEVGTGSRQENASKQKTQPGARAHSFTAPVIADT